MNLEINNVIPNGESTVCLTCNTRLSRYRTNRHHKSLFLIQSDWAVYRLRFIAIFRTVKRGSHIEDMQLNPILVDAPDDGHTEVTY